MGLSETYNSLIAMEDFKTIPDFIYHLSWKDVGDTLKVRESRNYTYNKLHAIGGWNESLYDRFCVSNSIEGCIIALMGWVRPVGTQKLWVSYQEDDIELKDPCELELYVYGCDASKLGPDTYVSNEKIVKNKLVWDAPATGEAWILKPVTMQKLGKVIVHRNSKDYRAIKFKGIRYVSSIGNKSIRTVYAWPYDFLSANETTLPSFEFTTEDIDRYFRIHHYSGTKTLSPTEENRELNLIISMYKSLKQVPYNDTGTTVDSKTLLRQGGVCFDFVRYIAEYCNNLDIEYETFFMACYTDEGDPCMWNTRTHTFILLKIRGRIYWVEAAWKDIMGVYHFEDHDKAIEYIRTRFMDEETTALARRFEKEKKKPYLNIPTIFRYDALDTGYLNISIPDFVVRIGGTSKVKGIGEKYTLPFRKFVPDIPDKNAFMKIKI